MSFDLPLLESSFFDLRTSLGPQPKANTNIVLVTVDQETTELLDGIAPLSLDIHTRFMESLESYNPRAVGYLIDMNRVAEANPELLRSEWGPRFVDSAKRLESKGIPVVLGSLFDVTGEVLPPYPLSSLSHSIARIHKDGNVFSDDKVTRRALTYLYDRPVFHMELAQKMALVSVGHEPPGSYYLPEVDAKYFFFRYHGDPANQPYPKVSFLDVLNGKAPKELVKDKILLVGTLMKENAQDFALTPYSKNPFANPKLTVHANILDSILENRGIARAPTWVDGVITLFMICFVVFWVLLSKPLYGVFATLGIAAIFLFANILAFGYLEIWLKASQPILGVFLSYYLVVPYRLILEYKKRWDLQRKNELLVQVEELKTNFMSLVTHDLKTPVAKIQGLAEVLMRKASERLQEGDRETVNSIINSTQELNHFISSILELNKVESNRLEMQSQSKDINQLIERSIEQFIPAARARRIDIIQALEPLFPIRIDANLISKVINNLIDNALKYSPEDSKITVSSREVDGFVEFSVSDHGIGMDQEEIQNLFTKFYRAKNDTTTRISGTGLGLYLTRYFVEAHHGRVEVESEPGKGSTFRIFLPLESPSRASPGLKADVSPSFKDRILKTINRIN